MSKPFIINDPIHGPIQLSELEQKVIDHQYFQRLRRIKALGFLDRVFPGARHSRFEHSIGASHVVGRITKNIIEATEALSPSKDVLWNPATEFQALSSSEVRNILNPDRKKQIKIAALLHDVGHGPFSHASEKIMPKRSRLIEENTFIPGYIKSSINNREKKDKKEGKDRAEYADHEDYSMILTFKILSDIKNDHSNLISDDDIQWIISLKSDQVDPPGESKNKLESDLLRQFVDGEFDCDRMDYLLRDSHFCGVPYGKFDINRLLSGLCLTKNLKRNEYSLAIERSSVSAFEDFLFARFQMHVQLYTHRVDASCNLTLRKISEADEFELPPKIEEYVTFDDESFLYKYNKPGFTKLKSFLLDRNLWKAIFQTFTADQTTAISIIQKFETELGTISCGKDVAERPIRKEKLLKLPIVTRDLTGKLLTQQVKAISDLINHYNTVHYAIRVFVERNKKQKGEEILKTFAPVSETSLQEEHQIRQQALGAESVNEKLHLKDDKKANS